MPPGKKEPPNRLMGGYPDAVQPTDIGNIPIVMIPPHMQGQYADVEAKLSSPNDGVHRSLTRSRTLTRPKSLNRPSRPSNAATPRRNLLEDDIHDRLTPWRVYYMLITCCFPSWVLSKWGGMDSRDMQRAWREKVALCSIVLYMCAGLAFITFGLQTAICQVEGASFSLKDISNFGPGNNPHHFVIFGGVYNMDSVLRTHKDLPTFATDPAKTTAVERATGIDITPYFSKPLDGNCQSKLKTTVTLKCSSSSFPTITYCHKQDVVTPILDRIFVGAVTYTWDEVKNGKNLVVFSGFVMDLSTYIQENVKMFGDEIDAILRANIGKDATKAIAQIPDGNEIGHCMLKINSVGRLERSSTGCWASQVVLFVSFTVIISLIGARFLLALFFRWAISSKLGRLEKNHSQNRRQAVRKTELYEGKFPITLQDTHGNIKSRFTPSTPAKSGTLLKRSATKSKSSYGDEVHTIMLVTCYSEDEHALRTTFDSLVETQYNEDFKLLFIVADGMITGSGNSKSTPELILDMLELDENWGTPAPLVYEAVADGLRQINRAKVYCGWYNKGNTSVPTILVVKCGSETETQKPGNRGKRDSQIILMRFLERVTFNQRLCPLEFDLFQKMHYLMGVTPDYFEIVLMVDADTKIAKDSLARMVAAMVSDPSVMGLCGETRIGNKNDSWVSRIQVFEYYLSHHMNKAFESMFGGVTCLPGCFCMYRIKAQKGDTWVPILCSPEIVGTYSQSVVKTLHQKNLLLLGEDRFLTTMMLRTFPNRKLIFVPSAFCKTTVPNKFSVLLSQRRRWINSTIHNLMELILVNELCGMFCFSMQFVIFLEMIGMVTLPAAIIFTGLLIIVSIVGVPQVVPLILLAAILGLPAILILFTTRRVVYIYWMAVYLLALPIWNFVLPVYAFWHFDDFSWGQTRRVNNDSGGHGDSSDTRSIGPEAIPLKRWEDWERDRRAQIVISYKRRNSSMPK